MRVKYETSLEEAKKIKELGYDFSFCCRKFYSFVDKKYYYFDENHGDILTTDRFWLDGDIETFAEIIEYHGFIDTYDFVPIIPYPILEACLPGHVMRYHNWNYCIKAYLNYPETQIMGMDYEFNFDQLVEAFIYCAENYPQETRKQFEKLKEQYK